MQNYAISNEIFWSEKDKGAAISVVKLTDPKIFNLEGIAAVVFLSIARNQDFPAHHDQNLIQKVLKDLKTLEFIQGS